MIEFKQVLKEIGAKNGLDMELDENGACTLELADGRVMLVQERADLGELDFVATLGPVPEESRAAVFTELLAANFSPPGRSASPICSQRRRMSATARKTGKTRPTTGKTMT